VQFCWNGVTGMMLAPAFGASVGSVMRPQSAFSAPGQVNFNK
jgi:hypothetical protein